MSVPVEPVYLVIRDAALRSSLTAWLGLSGHSIVALQDLATLVGSRPSPTALFVIDSDLLPEDRANWPGVIGPTLPCARCIILVAGETGLYGRLVLADRSAALPLIQSTIARIESGQPSG